MEAGGGSRTMQSGFRRPDGDMAGSYDPTRETWLLLLRFVLIKRYIESTKTFRNALESLFTVEFTG